MTSTDRQERLTQLTERINALNLGESAAKLVAAFNAHCGPEQLAFSDEARARMRASADRLAAVMRACVDTMQPGLERLAEASRRLN